MSRFSDLDLDFTLNPISKDVISCGIMMPSKDP